MLARELNIDYANFGFSGRGKAEASVAGALAEVTTSCFVIDGVQNASVKELEARFRPFLKIVRAAQPQTPILAVTGVFSGVELWSDSEHQIREQKRETIRRVVRDEQPADPGLHLLEALDYFGSDVTDGSVDGTHPNEIGFTRIAAGMKPCLARILGLA